MKGFIQKDLLSRYTHLKSSQFEREKREKQKPQKKTKKTKKIKIKKQHGPKRTTSVSSTTVSALWSCVNYDCQFHHKYYKTLKFEPFFFSLSLSLFCMQKLQNSFVFISSLSSSCTTISTTAPIPRRHL